MTTPVWIYRHPDITNGELNLQYSVGAYEASGRSNGTVGTFQTLDNARLFADALAARHGTEVIVLPSANPANIHP